MNQLEQKSGMSKSIRQMISSTLLLAVLFVGFHSTHAQQAAKPPEPRAQAQQSIQSVVANQAALVSEFDVNGLKVLLKRREGSLTVAAGLFIRGGASNINAQNAGIETLMLSAATEATTNFPRSFLLMLPIPAAARFAAFVSEPSGRSDSPVSTRRHSSSLLLPPPCWPGRRTAMASSVELSIPFSSENR